MAFKTDFDGVPELARTLRSIQLWHERYGIIQRHSRARGVRRRSIRRHGDRDERARLGRRSVLRVPPNFFAAAPTPCLVPELYLPQRLPCFGAPYIGPLHAASLGLEASLAMDDQQANRPHRAKRDKGKGKAAAQPDAKGRNPKASRHSR